VRVFSVTKLCATVQPGAFHASMERSRSGRRQQRHPWPRSTSLCRLIVSWPQTAPDNYRRWGGHSSSSQTTVGRLDGTIIDRLIGFKQMRSDSLISTIRRQWQKVGDMKERASEQKRERCMDGWIDGRMDGWMDGWMDRWKDGWMDRSIDRQMNRYR